MRLMHIKKGEKIWRSTRVASSYTTRQLSECNNLALYKAIFWTSFQLPKRVNTSQLAILYRNRQCWTAWLLWYSVYSWLSSSQPFLVYYLSHYNEHAFKCNTFSFLNISCHSNESLCTFPVISFMNKIYYVTICLLVSFTHQTHTHNLWFNRQQLLNPDSF